MSETAFCYHCGTHHPIEVMRQILTKTGKRWRCIKSIEATKAGIAKRDAYGRGISAMHKADTQANIRKMANPERDPHS